MTTQKSEEKDTKSLMSEKYCRRESSIHNFFFLKNKEYNSYLFKRFI